MIGESLHIQCPIWSFPPGRIAVLQEIAVLQDTYDIIFNRVELLYSIDLLFNNLNKHGHFPRTNQMALP
jgi:hypothetical protein